MAYVSNWADRLVAAGGHGNDETSGTGVGIEQEDNVEHLGNLFRSSSQNHSTYFGEEDSLVNNNIANLFPKALSSSALELSDIMEALGDGYRSRLSGPGGARGGNFQSLGRVAAAPFRDSDSVQSLGNARSYGRHSLDFSTLERKKDSSKLDFPIPRIDKSRTQTISTFEQRKYQQMEDFHNSRFMSAEVPNKSIGALVEGRNRSQSSINDEISTESSVEKVQGVENRLRALVSSVLASSPG